MLTTAATLLSKPQKRTARHHHKESSRYVDARSTNRGGSARLRFTTRRQRARDEPDLEKETARR